MTEKETTIMSDRYKQETINEYEKVLESLEMVGEFLNLTINRFKKKIQGIKTEETNKEGVIKNMTKTVLCIEFDHNSRKKGSHIFIKDYIYKNEIMKEYLDSPELLKLYRMNLIKDITEEEMKEEKRTAKPNDITGRTELEPIPMPVRPSKYIRKNYSVTENMLNKVGGFPKKVKRVKPQEWERENAEIVDKTLGGLFNFSQTLEDDSYPEKINISKDEECRVLSKEEIKNIISNQFENKSKKTKRRKKTMAKKPAVKKPAVKKPAVKKPAVKKTK